MDFALTRQEIKTANDLIQFFLDKDVGIFVPVRTTQIEPQQML